MGDSEIQSKLSRLEQDKARYEEKLGVQPGHDKCLVKMTEKVKELESQLEQNGGNATNGAGLPEAAAGGQIEGEATARGDEFEKVDKLQNAANELESKNKGKEAEAVKDQVRTIVAKELNELDGFDR
jgi:hypothetical protein